MGDSIARTGESERDRERQRERERGGGGEGQGEFLVAGGMSSGIFAPVFVFLTASLAQHAPAQDTSCKFRAL